MDEPESTPPMGPECPWCSAPLSAPDQATCPSCGAHVGGEADVDLPGVTSLDQETRIRLERAERAAAVTSRRGLLGWITAEDDAGPAVDSELASLLAGAKVDPPSDDVRREMLRLEIEALRREAEAEAAHLEAEATALSEAAGDTDAVTDATPGAVDLMGADAGGEADEPA